MLNLIKKIILFVFITIIVFFVFNEVKLNNQPSAASVQNQEPLLSENGRPVPAVLLPLSQEQESQKTSYSLLTTIQSVKNQIENLGLQTDPITLYSKINAAIGDEGYWKEKEEEVAEARQTISSVPLGIQCGGRILTEPGIGPLTRRPCCTGCCVGCSPICCGDCGCCVASCERICECISGPGAAYLWDSITDICGCGIEP
ncbi:MAG: hypothetical protein CO003_00960 [Candidatus Portnoybacteria bacterium CG_4_8_14_3_um_filter_44_15]|uniref:4Fe-4S ferredoxin-type domain-containing protein n=2 Tax=Candidatus Portnoyibacteriota TaxID=1817913 RepID=A0A2M7IE22_9BACT|nr:MAG: hypothetical protein CO003_00960 [Candidatus Portnoybacteria bacterium CG_4_8_14_3_um_filter_44_15]PIZ69137.1 MAG: hypothetical protein COY10_02055 [Candidatus Portnoybacteria bacterium CG_4_10_14_0_2_um_filter_43_36]